MDVYREHAQDTGQAIDVRRRRIRLNRWAWISIPVLLLAVLGFLDVRMSGGSIYPILTLKLAYNFIFMGLVGLMAATLFGRNFLNHGAPGLLLLGCGAVFWSASGVVSVIAGLASPHGYNINTSITIHNICIWEASLCYLAGATFMLRWGAPIAAIRSRWLTGAYALAASVVGFTVAATLLGWTPVFFVPGEGGTEVRYLVLISTIIMLLFAVRLLWAATFSPRPSFLRWYTLSLSLLALGYSIIIFQTVFVETLNWISQIVQYVGGIAMFVAARAAFFKEDKQLEALAQPRNDTRHPYSLAIVIVFFAAVLRIVFLQAMGTQTAFITFFPAMVLAALYGGYRAGILATFISAALADYFWIEPVGTLAAKTTADQLSITIFLATGIMISWIANRLQQSESKLRIIEANRREELERLVAERTTELGESESRFRAAQEASLDSFIIYEPVKDAEGQITDFKVVYANRMTAECCCTTPEKMQGRPISEIIPGSKLSGGLIDRHRKISLSGKPEEYVLDYDADGIKGYFRNLVVPFGPYVATTFRDITNIIQAERDLRESEARARRLEDTLTQGVVYRDREGNVVRMNPAAEMILGGGIKKLYDYAKDVEYDALRENGSPFPKSEHPIMECFANWKSRVQSRDGNIQPAHENVPVAHRSTRCRCSISARTRLMKPIRSFPTSRNRKLAEQALRQSEEYAQLLEKTLTQGVIHRNRDGRIIRANSAAGKILGRTVEELMGRGLETLKLHTIREDGNFFSEDDHPVIQALRTGKTLSNIVMGVFNPRVNGYRWVSIDAVPLFHPGENTPYESYTIFSDITERKQAKLDLMRADVGSSARAITKYSPDLIFAKDCQCRVVHASDSLLHLLGKKPEEVLGKTDAEFYADPKVGEVIMENDRIVRETGLPLVVEERPELPDGTLRTFRSTKVPWLSDDGSLLGTFGIAVDINELKTKEQELSKAREAAERADLSKSKFLAAASHDLRQPVQSLALLLTVLEKHSSNNPKIDQDGRHDEDGGGQLDGDAFQHPRHFPPRCRSGDACDEGRRRRRNRRSTGKRIRSDGKEQGPEVEVGTARASGHGPTPICWSAPCAI
jgi:PAS domain S-box-containing protein